MDEDVEAETPAGARALTLAKQAGVDFSSVDSLRIARLSVMIRKDLRLKKNELPLEFKDLREACTSKKSFVELIDRRMELPDEELTVSATSDPSVRTNRFASWAQGGAVVHR